MVYIDQMNIHYKGMVMNHMMADTKQELLDMADKIGVKRKWIQKEGTEQEHFDVCLSKKRLAISLGAKEVGWREIYNLMKSKKEAI